MPFVNGETTKSLVGVSGAAQESNLPTVGLRRLAGFEDRLGHRARPLHAERN
jgi:hypothetical protein